MQGGNEYENNDDVNDANVYVYKCDPVFNSFVAYLNAQRPGKFLGFFCILDTFNKLGYKAKINTHTTSYIN